MCAKRPRRLLRALLVKGESVKLEVNRVIKSLSSLPYFSKVFHSARMNLHTDRMPYFFMVNDFYGHDESH
jgi:hypothetical protein